MSNAIEHFSRCRVENTTLQVMADLQRDLDRLIREEQSVIRHYVRLGNWPHKQVNMFVFENLQPLVAQIKGATALSSVIANDIDRRPMVNVYDSADLTECAVFVNRGALERDGVWHDDVALRALLAHEHGHPLAENETVRGARELSVEVAVESPMSRRLSAASPSAGRSAMRSRARRRYSRTRSRFGPALDLRCSTSTGESSIKPGWGSASGHSGARPGPTSPGTKAERGPGGRAPSGRRSAGASAIRP